MYKFYIMNISAFIAGTALYAVSCRYSYRSRLALLLLGIVVVNSIIAVLMLLGKVDKHIYPFLCSLPFLLPHILAELKKELEKLPPKKVKTMVIGNAKDGTDKTEVANCRYRLLVQLKLHLKNGRAIAIRSKADEDLPFLHWINRVLYDYTLKYPYSSKEISEIRGKKIDFYHYRYLFVKYMIESDKTFKENRLKNNSRIYGKQVG